MRTILTLMLFLVMALPAAAQQMLLYGSLLSGSGAPRTNVIMTMNLVAPRNLIGMSSDQLQTTTDTNGNFLFTNNTPVAVLWALSAGDSSNTRWPIATWLGVAGSNTIWNLADWNAVIPCNSQSNYFSKAEVLSLLGTNSGGSPISPGTNIFAVTNAGAVSFNVPTTAFDAPGAAASVLALAVTNNQVVIPLGDSVTPSDAIVWSLPTANPLVSHFDTVTATTNGFNFSGGQLLISGETNSGNAGISGVVSASNLVGAITATSGGNVVTNNQPTINFTTANSSTVNAININASGQILNTGVGGIQSSAGAITNNYSGGPISSIGGFQTTAGSTYKGTVDSTLSGTGAFNTTGNAATATAAITATSATLAATAINSSGTGTAQETNDNRVVSATNQANQFGGTFAGPGTVNPYEPNSLDTNTVSGLTGATASIQTLNVSGNLNVSGVVNGNLSGGTNLNGPITMPDGIGTSWTQSKTIPPAQILSARQYTWFNNSNTAFIDPINGSDTSGQIGQFGVHPFLTLTNAVAKSPTNGGAIYLVGTNVSAVVSAYVNTNSIAQVLFLNKNLCWLLNGNSITNYPGFGFIQCGAYTTNYFYDGSLVNVELSGLDTNYFNIIAKNCTFSSYGNPTIQAGRSIDQFDNCILTNNSSVFHKTGLLFCHNCLVSVNTPGSGGVSCFLGSTPGDCVYMRDCQLSAYGSSSFNEDLALQVTVNQPTEQVGILDNCQIEGGTNWTGTNNLIVATGTNTVIFLVDSLGINPAWIYTDGIAIVTANNSAALPWSPYLINTFFTNNPLAKAQVVATCYLTNGISGQAIIEETNISKQYANFAILPAISGISGQVIISDTVGVNDIVLFTNISTLASANNVSMTSTTTLFAK